KNLKLRFFFSLVQMLTSSLSTSFFIQQLLSTRVFQISCCKFARSLSLNLNYRKRGRNTETYSNISLEAQLLRNWIARFKQCFKWRTTTM
ncbi:hypothetical protein PMAYCL1PPCAC_03863, partial [Pristionchus mayeri]